MIVMTITLLWLFSSLLLLLLCYVMSLSLSLCIFCCTVLRGFVVSATLRETSTRNAQTNVKNASDAAPHDQFNAILTAIISPPNPTITALVWHIFLSGTYRSALWSLQSISYRGLCSGGGGGNLGSHMRHPFSERLAEYCWNKSTCEIPWKARYPWS